MDTVEIGDFVGIMIADDLDMNDRIDFITFNRLVSALTMAGVELHIEKGVIYANYGQMRTVVEVMAALSLEAAKRGE